MFLSLKNSLSDKISDFLENSQMSCPITQQGVVELVNSLSRYTEEGQALFPKIYVFDDYKILDALVYFEKFPIGHGNKLARTFSEGLKKIAPLAIESWNIYFKRNSNNIEYGLFRSGESIISVSPQQLIVTNGQKEQPVVFIQQVGEGLIELRSWNNSHLLVSFGIEDNLISPTVNLENFIKCVSKNVDPKFTEQYETILIRIITAVTQRKHGTIAIIYKGKDIHKEAAFKDGQILKEPIKIIDKLKAFKEESDNIGQSPLKYNSDLVSYLHLISGMMLSDGITVFNDSGSVLAYNVFIKDNRRNKAKEDSPEEEKKTMGGARTRAFEYLCSFPKSKISGVFMQSQDGAIKFHENEQ